MKGTTTQQRSLLLRRNTRLEYLVDRPCETVSGWKINVHVGPYPFLHRLNFFFANHAVNRKDVTLQKMLHSILHNLQANSQD